MALPENEKWILAENLKRTEQKDIERVARGEDGSQSDFAAYYALLTGTNTEWAGMHAVADERYLASYLRQLARLISANLAHGNSTPSLLDVGCGPGFLTQRMHSGLGCNAMGIDISESGIRYARAQFPGCRFEVVAVEKSMELGEQFDIVHAREFYPFTRTADLDFHKEYTEALARHVKQGGIMVLTLLSKSNSLAPNADSLAPTLAQFGMTPFKRIVVANKQIPSWVPLPLARLATKLAMKLKGRPAVEFYLSRRA